MDRRNFVEKSIFAGLACSCININRLKGNLVNSEDKFTPCDEKINFVKKWTERFFNVLDEHIDEETRFKIMQQNGKMCYEGSHEDTVAEKPRTFEEIDESIMEIRKWTGGENPRRSGNTIFFNYVQNPRGLRVDEGYCLCPMLEDGPAKISPTYCQCSVGYVHQMFNRITGRKVKVDLLESIRTGGKQCSFKIEIVD